MRFRKLAAKLDVLRVQSVRLVRSFASWRHCLQKLSPDLIAVNNVQKSLFISLSTENIPGK